MKKLYPTLRDFSLIILGGFIQAIGLRLFFIPANLASGGVSGVAQTGVVETTPKPAGSSRSSVPEPTRVAASRSSIGS